MGKVVDEEDNEVENIFNVLQSGDENIKLPKNENIVLVLGNSGSGKSTFTQYVAGDSESLEAIELVKDSGEFVIVDPESRISRKSTILSHTVYPDLVYNEATKTIFYDCPGFSDTRSPAYDISTSYFIKKVIDSSQAVKLVFVVSYHSVRKGVDRKDFMLLLKHATTLLKKTDNFVESIALIATKVDNQFINRKGEDPSLVPDDKVVESIVEFLRVVKHDIKTQMNTVSKDYSFQKKALTLIESLLTNADNDSKRIGILRRPDEPGKIVNSSLFQNKKILENIIYKNIKYTEKKEDDFGYTLSADSINYIHDLAEVVNENINTQINLIGKDVKEHFDAEEKNTQDIYVLLEKFSDKYDIFSKYETDPDKITNGVLMKILGDLKHLNIVISEKKIHKILNYHSYLMFFQTLSGQLTENQQLWCQGLRNMTNFFYDSKKWYHFLENLHNWLSEYPVQVNISELNVSNLINHSKIRKHGEIKVSQIDLHSLLNIKTMADQYNIDSIYNNIKDVIVTKTKIEILRKMLNSFFNEKMEFFCPTPTKLIIKGAFVKLSEIKNITCGNKIEFIEILATNKVFIDSDVHKVGENLQMSIIAPIWDVIGNRKIILDGKPGEELGKAKDGLHLGIDGMAGKPGLPGGPGGRFLGIVNNVKGGNLHISVNGGKGGPGQEGGDGADGKYGNDAPRAKDGALTSIFNQWGPEYDWEDQDIKWTSEGKTERILVAWYYYSAQGEKATNGGNGGDGGVGGLGGREGVVTLLALKGEQISVSKKSGENGNSGRGGKGGLKAEHGRDVKAKCSIYRIILIAYTDCDYYPLIYRGFSKNGTDGETGRNTKGLTNPNKSVELVMPSLTVNNYKNYLRQTLKSSVRVSFLLEWLKEVDRNVFGLYNSLGLFNELEGLEKQFYSDNSKIEILPFYQSLLNRIEKYSINPHPYEKTLEYKKFLSYLYTTALSKICSSKDYKSGLIVDIPEFLDRTIEDINKLKASMNNVAILENKRNFQIKIEREIQNMENTLEKIIFKHIDNIFSEIDQKILDIIKQTSDEISTLNEQNNQLRQLKHELENKLVLRMLATPLKLVGGFLDFLGPVGETILPLIENGVVMLEYLIFDDNRSKEGADRVNGFMQGLTSFLGETLIKMSNATSDNQELFKYELDDIASDLVRHLTQNERQGGLSTVYNKLQEVKQKVQEKISTEPIVNPEYFHSMRQEVSGILDGNKIVLNEQMPPREVEKELKVLNDTQKLITLNGISPDLYLHIRNSKAKISVVQEHFERLKVKVAMLRNFEKNIYRIIIPKMIYLRDVINESKTSLQNRTDIELIIKKMEIQNTLRDIKFEINQISKGFSAEETLTRCFEKIGEALATVIDVFNRLHEYIDKVKLANYIADLNSNKATSIRLHNNELEEAVELLNVLIKSNILLEKYENAKGAFAQLVFPFADSYLSEYTLPFSLTLPNSTENLIFLTIHKLESMKSKLGHTAAIVTTYDEYIHKDVQFNSENNKARPFYIWKHESNQETIKKLLEGEEIILKADITNGVQENAVKFNEIGLNLKIKNKNIQELLDNHLQDYELTMVHFGTSYYKCGNKYYVIRSNPQEFHFSIQKNKNGQPLIKNLVYDKIKNNDYLLSPYTLWSIKLSHISSEFKTLRRYKNEAIDLELIGRGQYIENDQDFDVCDKNIEKYYELDDSVSDINIYHYFSETSNELNPELYILNRKRRNINNSWIDIEPFGKSGSSKKSSFINLTLDFVFSGLLALKNYNPISQISSMIFTTKKETSHPLISYMLPEKESFSSRSKFNRFAGTTNSTYDAIDSSNNILLWYVVAQKLGGRKINRCKRSNGFKSNEQNNISGHQLAYRSYFLLQNKDELAMKSHVPSVLTFDNNAILPSDQVIPPVQDKATMNNQNISLIGH